MGVGEQIKALIQRIGPVSPTQIAKNLGTSSIIASAHLSELVSKRELKLSFLKVGSSPLYNLPGQEDKLQNFSKHLHEKERIVYDMLLKDKVLWDKKVEPVVRVALRGIKDFAVPLQVNFQGNSEIFWKWYLLGNKEAEEQIKNLLGVKKKETPVEKEVKKEVIKEEPTQEIKKEPIKEVVSKKEINKEEKIIKTEKVEMEKSPEEKGDTTVGEEAQKKLLDTKEEKVVDDFFNSIEDYFSTNNVKVLEKNMIRKGSEAEFIIEVPSAVGTLNYYCKAKSKKRINEGDLSAAFIIGQTKKLPVLFLTKGDLTKKAQEMLNLEFKGMAVKKV